MVILFQQKILIPWLIFHLCDLAQRDPSEIYVGWGVPVKGRMLADVVVPLHERRDSAAALGDALVSADVDVLLLEGPPEPLDEYVVVGAAAAVHAQAGRAAFPVEDAGELSRRVLAALVRVEDLGPAVPVYRLAEGLLAEVRGKRRGKPPGKDAAAVPVDDRGQVGEALLQADVGDVRATDLVRAGRHDAAEQVGELPVHLARGGEEWLRADGGPQLALAGRGVVRVELVDEVHHLDFELREKVPVPRGPPCRPSQKSQATQVFF